MRAWVLPRRGALPALARTDRELLPSTTETVSALRMMKISTVGVGRRLPNGPPSDPDVRANASGSSLRS